MALIMFDGAGTDYTHFSPQSFSLITQTIECAAMYMYNCTMVFMPDM